MSSVSANTDCIRAELRNLIIGIQKTAMPANFVSRIASCIGIVNMYLDYADMCEEELLKQLENQQPEQKA